MLNKIEPNTDVAKSLFGKNSQLLSNRELLSVPAKFRNNFFFSNDNHNSNNYSIIELRATLVNTEPYQQLFIHLTHVTCVTPPVEPPYTFYTLYFVNDNPFEGRWMGLKSTLCSYVIGIRCDQSISFHWYTRPKPAVLYDLQGLEGIWNGL